MRITVHKTAEGTRLHSLNVMPKKERHPGNMRGLASAHLASSRVTSPITVEDLLPGVKMESDGTASAQFAADTKPAPAPEPTDNATIDREYTAHTGTRRRLNDGLNNKRRPAASGTHGRRPAGSTANAARSAADSAANAAEPQACNDSQKIPKSTAYPKHEKNQQLDEDARRLRADRALQNSLRNTR